MQLLRTSDSGLEPLDPTDPDGIFAKWDTGSDDLRKLLLASTRVFLEEELKITLGKSSYSLWINRIESATEVTIPRPPFLAPASLYYRSASFEYTQMTENEDYGIIGNRLLIVNAQGNEESSAYRLDYWGGTEDPITETSPEFRNVLLSVIAYWTRNKGSLVLKGTKGGVYLDKAILKKYLKSAFSHMYRWTL
jgi:hypothetical protein